VCDGFVGNIALKVSEGLAETIVEMLKRELMEKAQDKGGASIFKDVFKSFVKGLIIPNTEAPPLLGIGKPCIISHGRSTSKAIKNAIRVAGAFHGKGILDVISAEFSKDLARGSLLPLMSRITGTGSYVPEKVLDNFALAKKVDTSDEWITARTGIKARRTVTSGQTNSDMCLEASKRALQSAGLKPKDIDLIIVATMSGDMPMPSTAAILQTKLGAKHAAAFDINAACSGFCTAFRWLTSLSGPALHKSCSSSGRKSIHVFLTGKTGPPVCCSVTAPALWCLSRQGEKGHIVHTSSY